MLKVVTPLESASTSSTVAAPAAVQVTGHYAGVIRHPTLYLPLRERHRKGDELGILGRYPRVNAPDALSATKKMILRIGSPARRHNEDPVSRRVRGCGPSLGLGRAGRCGEGGCRCWRSECGLTLAGRLAGCWQGADSSEDTGQQAGTWGQPHDQLAVVAHQPGGDDDQVPP